MIRIREHKLIQLLDDLIKTKDSLVRFVIYNTPGSCRSRGSIYSKQDCSSDLTFMGKELTGELDEILIHLLNCQCNLTKGFNRLISSQASQMTITIGKLR